MPETDRLDDVAEAGREIARSIDNFARAICCLAVKQESRNPGEQRELAAIIWGDVVSDFHGVPVTEEMRSYLSTFLKIDPKAFPKRPYGR
jgi:hypothetical protein